MQFTFAAVLSLLAIVNAAAVTPSSPILSRQNANRPVPNGACCISATSLKQDVCNVNGQTGRCVPAGVNNCGDRLTCIEDNRLTCDATKLERGRPLCRLTNGA